MRTSALKRLVAAMGLAAAIHVPAGLWVASHIEEAPKTIATAHHQPVKLALRGAQASLSR